MRLSIHVIDVTKVSGESYPRISHQDITFDCMSIKLTHHSNGIMFIARDAYGDYDYYALFDDKNVKMDCYTRLISSDRDRVLEGTCYSHRAYISCSDEYLLSLGKRLSFGSGYKVV